MNIPISHFLCHAVLLTNSAIEKYSANPLRSESACHTTTPQFLSHTHVTNLPLTEKYLQPVQLAIPHISDRYTLDNIPSIRDTPTHFNSIKKIKLFNNCTPTSLAIDSHPKKTPSQPLGHQAECALDHVLLPSSRQQGRPPTPLTILNETLKTINDILPDDHYHISGRVKSAASQFGKILRLHLENKIGQDALTAMSQHPNAKALLAEIVSEHWNTMNQALVQNNADINDLIGIRIILQNNNIEHCYQSLKSILDSPSIQCFYELKSNTFKDYIKHAKNNNYQSLHAVIINHALPELTIELQVRTAEMHKISEQGDANHHSYKLLPNLIWALYIEHYTAILRHEVDGQP